MSVAFAYDWSWWYPSGNRPLQQYLGFTAGFRIMVSSSIRLTAWLQNQSGRNVREIDVWAESPRLSPLWLSTSSSACHGLLIITVITPLLQSPARQKCQRTEAGERGNYWPPNTSAWCCCARCKMRRVSWCWSWKWCSAWWCCRWSSSVASKQSVSQCVKPPPPRRG